MAITHNVTTEEYLVTFDVGPNQGGTRLDAFLKEHYRRRSRAQIQRAIEDGSVTIDRSSSTFAAVGRLKPSSPVLAGDKVLVLTERKPEPEVCFDYKTLYEDEALLVIDKPANLPVHPAGRFFFNTLLIHLKTKGHQYPLPHQHEYYLPHRIDRETSGILVLTKSVATCAHVVSQFATRATEKKYLAIVKGVAPEAFEISAPLARAPRSLISLKMAQVPLEQGGQEAFTRFKRVSAHGDFSLIECFPKTGRQHQIRVHLELAGHPIVGDKLYGMPEEDAVRFYERENLSPEAWAKMLLPRHALHAAELKITHPLTNKPMTFKSDLPAELQAFLSEQADPAQAGGAGHAAWKALSRFASSPRAGVTQSV